MKATKTKRLAHRPCHKMEEEISEVVTDKIEISVLLKQLRTFESIKRQLRIMKRLPDGGAKILNSIAELKKKLGIEKSTTPTKNSGRISKRSKQSKASEPVLCMPSLT